MDIKKITEKITLPIAIVISVIVLAIGVSYIIIRETPEECVQKKFLEWQELNKEEFLDSSEKSGITFPPYNVDEPDEVVARLKFVAKQPISNFNERSKRITWSSQLILGSCGVNY